MAIRPLSWAGMHARVSVCAHVCMCARARVHVCPGAYPCEQVCAVYVHVRFPVCVFVRVLGRGTWRDGASELCSQT